MKGKVAIIGAGSVGTAIAYAMMINGTARHIALIDANEAKAKGEALDLSHGKPFAPPVTITAGSYSECSDSEVIVITAGAKQRPNETRIDLLHRNIQIMKSICEEIKKNCKDITPIIIVVSNPCDILTYFAQQFLGFPRTKVIGSGTTLDTARFRYEIASHCNIDPKNIHGYVIGEHGDSEVILWSNLRIGAMLFGEHCNVCGRGCYPEFSKKVDDNVRNAAYKIIEAKGFTNYGVGLSVDKIVKAILRDSNTILPISMILEGEYGLSDVAISVPCIINSNGVREIMVLNISDSEIQKFKESAEKLKKVIFEIKNG